MRFQDLTILELAMTLRDSKANASGYDKDARETLRRACRLRIGERSLDDFLKRFEHPTDRELARQAWVEVQAYAKPAGYTSGVW